MKNKQWQLVVCFVLSFLATLAFLVAAQRMFRRLEAAIIAGTAQVVSCGALDMVNCWALETVPAAFRERTLHPHNANVTLMRTSPDECAKIGKEIGTRLSSARAPVTLMIPLRGVSMLEAPGEIFFAPESNKALFALLHANCTSSGTVKDYDLHINDPEFANAISDELIHNLQWKNRQVHCNPT